MARRKAETAETPTEASNPTLENPTSMAGNADQPASSAAQQNETRGPDEASDGHAAREQRKSTWAAEFGSWGDYEAGVRLVEDRQNHRMTIKFDDKPSESVRAMLKSQQNGFRFDPEDKLWYKRINLGKPGQARREAEDVAFQAANIIRQEKGLEQKKAFSLGM